MYLNQITFPDRESEGSFLRGLCELSMIPITPIKSCQRTPFLKSILNQSLSFTEATVQENHRTERPC